MCNRKKTSVYQVLKLPQKDNTYQICFLRFSENYCTQKNVYHKTPMVKRLLSNTRIHLCTVSLIWVSTRTCISRDTAWGLIKRSTASRVCSLSVYWKESPTFALWNDHKSSLSYLRMWIFVVHFYNYYNLVETQDTSWESIIRCWTPFLDRWNASQLWKQSRRRTFPLYALLRRKPKPVGIVIHVKAKKWSGTVLPRSRLLIQECFLGSMASPS